MKIEKISENQIRCTLSHQDLAERELKISELAYSSEKTRTLFKDMMQQASYEFGFEADNIPLMIEAIPVSMETLILVITKVEDPEELDDRLSRFSLGKEEDYEDEEYDEEEEERINAKMFSKFNHISNILDIDSDEDEYAGPEELNDTLTLGEDRKTLTPVPDDLSIERGFTRIFSFVSLDNASRFAAYTRGMYTGSNKLYKDNARSSYLLVLKNDGRDTDDFVKVCNAASEFGSIEQVSYVSASHIDEHCSLIIRDNALQILSSL